MKQPTTLGMLFLALATMATMATPALGWAQQKTDDPPIPEPPPPPPVQVKPDPNAGVDSPDKKMGFGVDLVGVLPFGDLASQGHPGIGGFVRFEHRLRPRLAVTGRLGYVFHGEKNLSKMLVVPLLAGAKLDLFGAVFAAAELGLVHTRIKATTGMIYPGPDDSLTLGATLGGGYRWRRLDFRLGLHILDVGDISKTTGLALGAGYTYWFR